MSQSTYYLECGRHVARLHRRRRRRAYAPTRNTAGHDNMRKSIHGFPLFPYMGMGLRLAAPELRQNKETKRSRCHESFVVTGINVNQTFNAA